jgi:hypothetical protein
MTTIETTISKINQELIRSFAGLDSWFDRDEPLLCTTLETLEQLMLTNRNLLLLIEKGGLKARALAHETGWKEKLKEYHFEIPVVKDNETDGFFSVHPLEHQERTDTIVLSEIRSELRDQLYRCLCQIDLLAAGEGALVKLQLPVDPCRELDLYQCFYFLAIYINRQVNTLLVRTTSVVDWLI